MSNEVAIGLMANLERVKAQATIHAGNFDQENYKAVYALFLQAFGRQALAEQARSKAMERYIDREVNNAKAQRR